MVRYSLRTLCLVVWTVALLMGVGFWLYPRIQAYRFLKELEAEDFDEGYLEKFEKVKSLGYGGQIAVWWALSDSDVRKQAWACKAIFQNCEASPAMKARLLDLLNSQDGDVWTGAAKALTNLDQELPAVDAQCQKRLVAPSAAKRLEALDFLVYNWTPSGYDLGVIPITRALKLAIVACLHDSDQRVRRRAIVTISALHIDTKEALEGIRHLLASGTADERQLCTRVLPYMEARAQGKVFVPGYFDFGGTWVPGKLVDPPAPGDTVRP